jgi:multiple sugar transport system permease protein
MTPSSKIVDRELAPKGQLSVIFRRSSKVGVPAWVPWAFVAPFLALFTIFVAIPATIALVTSFTDVGVRDLRNLFGADFVGLDTFASVLGNADFQRSVTNTALFVVLTVPITMIIGFGLAIVLDSGLKMRGFFRAAFYLPVVTNIVAAAMIWRYAFENSGLVNSMLETIGIGAQPWLTDTTLAVPVVASLGIWRNIGISMILFLAGLQSIPTELREAAAIDGAGFWRTLFGITIPLMRPTTLLVSVLLLIFFISIFEEPLLLTRGGPLGSTKTISYWVYDQFGYGNFSSALAGSFILLLIVGVISVIQFRVLRPKT